MHNLEKRVKRSLIIVISATTIILSSFLFVIYEVQAQYGSACSEYGVMAYESGGYCKCMSGYVFQDSYLGKQCVSADSVCRDDYGSMSRYNSLSDSCECSYGYSLGKDSMGRTQCISDTQACKNQLGYHATASGGQCKCSYGYVIDTNMFGDKQCTDGDQVCQDDHGYNSSYNSLSNKCECDDDYTFDDDHQCVEKQHNVYFKLLDINPEDNKELLIKSDYDYSKYIIRVGLGCFSTSISRYKGKDLVVNLGTDYDVDIFDTVVLQDHDQTCSIMSRERTYDDSFPKPEENSYYYYTPPVQTYTISTNTTLEPVHSQKPVNNQLETRSSDTDDAVFEDEKRITNAEVEISNFSTSSDESNESNVEKSEEVEVRENLFQKIISFFQGWF